MHVTTANQVPRNSQPTAVLIDALIAHLIAVGVIGPSADPSVIVSHLCSRSNRPAGAGEGRDYGQR